MQKSSSHNKLDEFSSTLTPEQKRAFYNILQGKQLGCVAGLAGTGKSYLLNALKKAYENEGYTVRGLGPDNATAGVLAENGFKQTDNIYRFLYLAHHGKLEPKKSKEVWIVDESGKLGSTALLEFLKLAEKCKAQVLFSGDPLQLPAVERGRMFYAFIKRYGREFLGDIKRQNNQEQRNIAKKLAIGQVGIAFDAISRNGGFRWCSSKREAMEELVKQWAIDRELFPRSSTVILAYTNAEVTSLNEYVRVYRKMRGELGEREFLCNTVCGEGRVQIRVSEGDRITFRKKDIDLGVINGASGILVKADINKFVVRFDNKKTVEFDPASYPYFQLSYASTYNRGQGGTFDRAFILHSPFLNREGFYVGFTRHVHKAYCFVSAEEAKCLSDLKRQAMRCSKLENTTDFITPDELEKQRDQHNKQSEINNLKASDSLLTRFQGSTLQVLDKLHTKAAAVIERIGDAMPDDAFYQSNPQLNKVPGHVEEAPKDNNLETDETLSRQILEPILTKEKDMVKQQRSVKSNGKSEKWQNLSEGSKNLLKNYYKLSDNASSLHAIVVAETEASGGHEKDTKHFSEWQQACSKRNEAAYQASRCLSDKELKEVLSKVSFDILCDRAMRHDAITQRQNNPKPDLEQVLRENIDGLLSNLFPEGPARRDKQGYRFGSKGSLSVACRGPKEGTFYNFETGEGGGLLKLIQVTMRVNPEEAKAWAHNFLGNPGDVVPVFKTVKRESKADETWVSLQPEKDHPAPKLSSISNYIYQTFDEVARYPYKDAQGNVLFYTLRLVEKNKPSKKQVIPLSYGYTQGGDEAPRWSLKGYQADKKPLYNLDLLYKHPKATVLIVEGEKTADAAQRMFEKEGIVVVTWLGGSAAASKADWVPVTFRNVIIFPDNDTPGFKASDTICAELRRLGVSSLKAVDKDILQKEFPEKWDLADPLPDNKSPGVIKDLLLNAEEKGIGINHLLSAMYAGKNLSNAEILKAQEILWRVDNRLRATLEAEFKGKSWEVRDRIIRESSLILLQEEEFTSRFQKEFAFQTNKSRAFAFVAMAYQASKGEQVSLESLNSLKEATRDTDALKSLQSNHSQKLDNGFKEFLVSKYHQACFEMGARSQLTERVQSQLVEETFHMEQQIVQMTTPRLQHFKSRVCEKEL